MSNTTLWIIIVIIVLIIIALVVAAIVLLITGNNNCKSSSRKKYKNGNVNLLICDSDSSCSGSCSGSSNCCDSNIPVASLNYTCLATPVYRKANRCPPYCPNTQNGLCFNRIQIIVGSEIDGYNETFGECLGITPTWLAVGQVSDTETTIFLFNYDTNSYVYNTKLTMLGIDPILSTNDVYLSVATVHAGVGVLYEYVYSTEWTLASSTSLLNPIVSISQYGEMVAIVSGFITYIYSSGTLLAEFGGLNSVSVGLSGDITKNYMIIGSLGAAYFFSKAISSTDWGAVSQSYPSDDLQFGAIVSMEDSKYVMSDYSNGRFLVYNVYCPATASAIIKVEGDPDLDVFNPGVLVTGYSNMILYSSKSSTFSPPTTCPTYVWNYDGGGPIVSAASANNIAVCYNLITGKSIDVFIKGI